MTKLSGKHALLYGAPALSLAIAVGIFSHQIARLHRSKTQLQTVSYQLAALEKRSKAHAAGANPRFMPVVAQSGDEESKFFEHVRTAAKNASANIVSWSSTTRPASILPPDAQTGSAGTATAVVQDPNSEQLLQGVTAIDSDLVVNGSFDAIKQFMRAILDSDRLLTIDNAVWKRTVGGATQLTVKVSRYVGNPVALNASDTGGTGSVGGHEG